MWGLIIVGLLLIAYYCWTTRCHSCGCDRACGCASTSQSCCCTGGSAVCGCGNCIMKRDPRERLYVNTTRTVHFHYTNWCGACANMKPVWAQVKAATAGSNVRYIEIDEDIAHTPGVSKYPTIMMVDEHGHTHRYDGPAEFAALRSWVVAPAM